MSFQQEFRNKEVVPHPRFGSESKPSGYNFTEFRIRGSFWGYADEKLFISSAIPADTSKQNYTVLPREYYVDILKLCRGCKRRFIFFAKEQKHWFEELGFFVDADCVRCTQCRVEDRKLKLIFQRYSVTVSKEQLSDTKLAELIVDAISLWNSKILRNENTLRRIKNSDLKQIPSFECTKSISNLVDSL